MPASTPQRGVVARAFGSLRGIVVSVNVLAMLLVGTVIVVSYGNGAATVASPWLSGPWLLPLLLALTVAGELTYVRLKHGDEVEELTLFEAAVVLNVLLLPPAAAVMVPVLALAIASLLRRRALVKAVFNLGSYAASTAVLVGMVDLLHDPTGELGFRTLAGLMLGTLGFTAVNLICLSLVLGLVGESSRWQVVREGWRLSVFMAVGTTALGATIVSIALHTPALLPFTALPAAALRFAYRAAAQESAEHERSARLLALSQVLAGRLGGDEVVSAFLLLSRQAFGADVALAVLDGEEGEDRTAIAVDAGSDTTTTRVATPEECCFLAEPVAAYLRAELPYGWASALVAPLEVDGRRVGIVVLAASSRKVLERRDLNQLTPLASALAVAMRGAQHLRQLVEETSKLKAVVNHSSDGIVVLDGRGHVQLWSPAVTALTGHDEAFAVGRPLREVMPAHSPDGAAIDAFELGSSALTPQAPRSNVEMGVTRSDGEHRWVRCAHTAVFAGDELVRDVLIVHDVTRERQVERLKTDFIATVSHELRTPVTPIKGYADLLRRKGNTMSPEKRTECLDIISDRASHLARLVEDLLLASRISSDDAPVHSMQPQIADLVAMTRRAAGDYGTEGASRLQLDITEHELLVVCDPTRVVQVTNNLISNALKYSAAGTPVRVRVARDNGRATVTVTDEGRGIPADQLERVFAKFHRVEDPMRMTTGGTGLGLYIARQLAHAMGGTLTVESTLNVGSTFTFTLPLAPAAIAAAMPGDPRATPGAAGPLRGLRPAFRPAAEGPRHRPPWAVPPPRPPGAAPSQAPPAPAAPTPRDADAGGTAARPVV